MPGCTGLEAAQALAEDWPEADGQPFPLLVFVTAYDDYALQAFQAQAVDYLVKPVDRTRLAACVARLQARLAATAATPQSGGGRRLAAASGDGSGSGGEGEEEKKGAAPKPAAAAAPGKPAAAPAKPAPATTPPGAAKPKPQG